ncbi:hypothetical protein AKJ51_01045 [candidate division MSBL1 archaeon SCGC-AAA382A20]|uniref:Uncharacterized protein n=1 Tax=candidate division MSBL1 archaeon SCGC-AAA382A20 TaxID=1698280 RepID=A0A133VMA6_9EURY|nr:hypothetical protein AKJ51_01045 [candidate division MSBL1 archaeon SCGC-AAA382A20]
MKKSEALERWKELNEGQNYMKHLVPIPYKQEGPKYGSYGLRIEGPSPFIDAVLSHLKDLLAAENDITRLGLSRKTVEPREDIEKENPYADGKHEVVYIRVHMRGGQAQHVNTVFGLHGKKTAKFGELVGT